MDKIEDETIWLTIGDAAQRTGVNPVTLRAWQRRFGLVVPKRTPKGHRLYGEVHLAQIEEILFWLNQGVPISKVKPLLKESQTKAAAQALPNQALSDAEQNQWLDHIEFLNQCCLEFNAAGLNSKLTELSGLYPFAVLKSSLYWPWLNGLNGLLLGRPDAVCVNGWLEQELAARIAKKRLSQLQGEAQTPSLLIEIAGGVKFNGLLMSAELLAYHVNHNLVSVTNCSELRLIIQRLAQRRIFILPKPQMSPSETRELQQFIHNANSDVYLVGSYAKVVNQALGTPHYNIGQLLKQCGYAVPAHLVEQHTTADGEHHE
ncbi:MerR family transcriptional regulator [Shewanella sp. MBTL60-007]|uniref:MerR family transcriptional regulator n=1 Tax=Shewanella sp. MBTL60-007 TaxID=2815911 RepID=UPI001BC03CC2|nr:MerR family transcriptional regulator [Shewanella sp. MBTL60-007]GIU29615.1 helix-turn-helix-type transcriptional regulator [Shewanella sp. MBTL60-007]